MDFAGSCWEVKASSICPASASASVSLAFDVAWHSPVQNGKSFDDLI